MEQKTKAVVSSFKGDNKLFKYVNLPILLLSSALVIIVIVTLIINQISPSMVCDSQNNDYLLTNAAQAFQENNTSQLSSVVSSIEQLSGYQKDPNCMYVLTVYYADSYNQPRSQQSLNTFNKDYNGKNVSTTLLKYRSVAELRKLVTDSSQQQQQLQQNAQNLSPISPPLNSSK